MHHTVHTIGSCGKPLVRRIPAFGGEKTPSFYKVHLTVRLCSFRPCSGTVSVVELSPSCLALSALGTKWACASTLFILNEVEGLNTLSLSKGRRKVNTPNFPLQVIFQRPLCSLVNYTHFGKIFLASMTLRFFQLSCQYSQNLLRHKLLHLRTYLLAKSLNSPKASNLFFPKPASPSSKRIQAT